MLLKKVARSSSQGFRNVGSQYLHWTLCFTVFSKVGQELVENFFPFVTICPNTSSKFVVKLSLSHLVVKSHSISISWGGIFWITVHAGDGNSNYWGQRTFRFQQAKRTPSCSPFSFLLNIYHYFHNILRA